MYFFFFLALIGSSCVKSSGSTFVTLALGHVQEKAATFPEAIARFAVAGSNYSRANKFVRQDSLFCALFGTILSWALCVTLEKSLWLCVPMCFSWCISSQRSLFWSTMSVRRRFHIRLTKIICGNKYILLIMF